MDKGGIVAAGHKATAEAGAEVLRAGGNAVDAAVAAVCTAFIAEPVLTGPGGGGFLLLREPDGKSVLYDGFASMPKYRPEELRHLDFREIPVDFGDTVQTFHIGQASVATPMLMAMLFQAQRKHGCIPMLEVVQPAINAARQGVILNQLQAGFIKLLEPILMPEDNCRTLYAPNSNLLQKGEKFSNSNWAHLLELLALDGIDEMYYGDVAKSIAKACTPGGLLRLDDLSAQHGHIRSPLQREAAGGILLTNPPPSSGGCLIAFSLHILEELQKRMSDISPRILLAEALRSASCSRSLNFDRHIHQTGIQNTFLSPVNFHQAIKVAMKRLRSPKPSCQREPKNRHGSTSHISVIDRNGMAVSITTSNGEGSGIVVPGTGIHLNNMLGEEDINPCGFHKLLPGETLSSMMAPTIFVRNGKPALILGSGGSNRLRGAILQVFYRHILAGENIESAVCAPRMHNEDHILDCEPDVLTSTERSFLQSIGWELRDWSKQSIYFGGVHAISIDGRGELYGAGDPRRGGSVAWA